MEKSNSELFIEVGGNLKQGEGFSKKSQKCSYGINKTTIFLFDKNLAISIEREVGTYVTFEFDDLLFYDYHAKKYFSKKISEVLKKFSNESKITHQKVLIVGLGNQNYACDSLGKMVCDKVLVTKPFLDKKMFSSKKMGEIYAVSLGVYGQTGLESAETIKSIVKQIKPNLVIAIDSLIADDINKLGFTVQLSDTKLSPGGGVGNNRIEVSKEVVGANVLAIGVPFVAHLTKDESKSNNIDVTIKDIEQKVDVLSKIIAKAINIAFNNLTELELLELTE